MQLKEFSQPPKSAISKSKTPGTKKQSIVTEETSEEEEAKDEEDETGLRQYDTHLLKQKETAEKKLKLQQKKRLLKIMKR